MKIAFLLNFPLEYKGGINYFRNLFYAVKNHGPENIEIILFVPRDLPGEYLSFFNPYVTVLETRILKRKSLFWLLDKLFEKLFGFNPLILAMLRRHKIDIVSHSNFISRGIKTINWIPDFQYVHFPNLWPLSRLNETKALHRKLAEKSSAIVLSSYAAFDDYKSQFATLAHKVSVLHFVSQPEKPLVLNLSEADKTELLGRYAIDRPFFYLPNQFWFHKNHKVVFASIKLLKDEGLDPLLITSGFMHDYRNKNQHVAELENFVIENGLNSNILFLGLIPYKDVLDLIITSVAVINPSYFEGWSSTVEEAKTFGKRVILSKIKVHEEQCPRLGLYFNPDSPAELAAHMRDLDVKNSDDRINIDVLKKDLAERTRIFAEEYLGIVRKAFN